MTSAEIVRARIARLILGEPPPDAKIGSVSLKPHQLSAVGRIERALEEFGGALLSDEVGMGKTYVAAAIGRRYSHLLVVAPASLRQMWRHALDATAVDADFVSFEQLSRACSNDRLFSRDSPDSARAHDLLVIDEAHHARNKATRRFARLKQLTRDAKVLLLTATPIHNRRDELSTVLSLFLGSRANAMTPAELGRCVVRRAHEQIESSSLIPRVLPTVTLQISDDPDIVRDLVTLPEPIPVRDGGLCRGLIGRGLVHQWASSEAALNEALSRRIARSFALIASLEAGTYPTERELRSWVFDDGALQLGFPDLLSAPTAGAAALLETIRIHANALQRFRASHSTSSSRDAERADAIASLRTSHPSAKIVAFAQYTATVSTLFRRLMKAGGVAMLTARGARVAGGNLSRSEALARFAPRAVHAPPPSAAETINLLLSTDLLSEGVNLQDAEVVVHLDVPWTAARLEQRVGRVARMGSSHSAVSVYLIRPPASAATLLENEILVQRKWDIARRAESVAQQTEKLRAILVGWRRSEVEAQDDEPLVAAVSSPQSGFLAAITVGEKTSLVVSLSGQPSTNIESQIVASRLADGVDVGTGRAEYQNALREIREWLERESASELAGIANSAAPRRNRLVSRIDAAIENAPPQSRSRRLAAAAKARFVAAAPHGAAIEEELESLARSHMSDDDWLAAVAQLDSARAVRLRAEVPGLQIHAVLLMRPGS